LRIRGAEGRVVEAIVKFIAETWDESLVARAWEEFWNWEDVPDDMTAMPEFESMFVPWLVLGFVPDSADEDADPEWPDQPLGLEWLARRAVEIPDVDRAYIEKACRSPMSVFAVQGVDSGRSIDLKDVLTGGRFHVLEQSASRNMRPADLIFARVVTIDGVSVMFGAAPYLVPARWHTHIIDWRESLFATSLMTVEHLADFDMEIRELYHDIVAELLNPAPPQLSNTDGDPLELTTMTYELRIAASEAVRKLTPLATVLGEEHIDEIDRDESDEIIGASLTWMKEGNRQHEAWDNTVLGRIRIEGERLVAEVNSARRAGRLKREIAKRLGTGATLLETTVADTEGMLEQGARRRAAGEVLDEPEVPSAEVQAMLDEEMRRHWAEWLDTPVPALLNKTPREALLTPGGRERLEALLDEFEPRATEGPPGAAVHVAALRVALALPRRE
jgi:hypothetical protein